MSGTAGRTDGKTAVWSISARSRVDIDRFRNAPLPRLFTGRSVAPVGIRSPAASAIRAMTHRPADAEERYRLLARLGRLVSSSLDLREVFRRAADEVRR